MNQKTLLGYNFRVLMLKNWLLLAFPIAVSQLTVFWLGITRRFSPDLPAEYVEMVTPILAAFLGAHLLSAEYRSRIGAILATRPVHIGRIVLMRLAVMLALVFGLAVISLLAFWIFWGTPYDMITPVLACIPSTLFLTMLSLTFATLFRNSLAGFAVAAIYWCIDLIPGPPIQPYLSLKSLSSYYAVQHITLQQTFVLHWWIAKLLLLAGAVALYYYHNRLVPSVGSPFTIRVRRRAALAAGGSICLVLLSGAAVKVGYGYSHLGELPRGDLAWFRYQMAPFGPIPMPALFGASFRNYIGDIGNPWQMSGEDTTNLIGDTVQHRLAMHAVLHSSPNSVWAPSIAYGLSSMELSGATPEAADAYLRNIINRYPTSTYCQDALRGIARAYDDGKEPEKARAAYEELLKSWPQTRHRAEAYRYLFESEKNAQHLPEALSWAEKWSGVAPVEERFEALLDVLELRKGAGDMAGAKRAAADTLAAVAAFDHAKDAGDIELTPGQSITRPQLARRAEQEARAIH